MTSGNAASRATAQGNLTERPFAHLLVYLDQHALSGTLVLWTDPRDRTLQERVLFEGGRPTAGRFHLPVRSVEEGLLPFFALERAPYAFYEADLVRHASGAVHGAVDSLALIAQSLRGDARDDVVDGVLEQLGRTRLRLRPHAPIPRLALNDDERTLVDVLRAEPSDAAQLIRQSGLPERKARRLVYLLAITQMVEPFQPSRPSMPATSASGTLPSQPNVHPSSRRSSEAGVGRDKRQSASSSRPPSRPALRASQGSRARPTPPKPDTLTPEESAFWDEIIQRYDAIDEQTYFQMLGVDEGAGAGDSRRAYLKIVKKWHPDRLPSALEPLRPRVEILFGHLSEAHACLSNDEKRIEYLKTVREGGGTPAADRRLAQILEAAMEFQKVEVLARRHAHAEALELLDKSLRLNPEEPDYHAMHAWLLERMHQGPDAPLDEILDATQRALELNPDHERAHYCRALVLRKAGREREAMQHFRRVAELNPRHVDANRHVHIDEIKKARKREEANAAQGLLGKLFRRK